MDFVGDHFTNTGKSDDHFILKSGDDSGISLDILDKNSSYTDTLECQEYPRNELDKMTKALVILA